MPETQIQPQYGQLFRRPPGPPASRTIVAAVVTEVAAVLEPVGRDPFIDGSDDVSRTRPTTPARGRLADLRCA